MAHLVAHFVADRPPRAAALHRWGAVAAPRAASALEHLGYVKPEMLAASGPADLAGRIREPERQQAAPTASPAEDRFASGASIRSWGLLGLKASVRWAHRDETA